MNKYFKDVLTDKQIELIKTFNSNEEMREAVKTVLLAVVYNQGTIKKGKNSNPLCNFALDLVARKKDATNEELGLDLKATWKGIDALISGFQEIETFVNDAGDVEDKNPAR